MFMDGYRHILEQFLGGMGRQNGSLPPEPNYPPYQQPPQSYRIPNGHATRQSFQGQGHSLGGGPPRPQQPAPNQQPPPPTRRFHYSVTTYGPGGRIHHISSDSRPDSPLSDGRQIAVPTLDDFLRMHEHPGFGPQAGRDYEGPLSPGSLGMFLQQLMESVAPIHGDRGDYLPFVRFFEMSLIIGNDDG